MTALGKLLRTTAFQLTLVYLVVFALFAAFLVGYFALNTRRLINEQIVGTVDTEVTALTGQYNQAGIRRLVVIVDVRSRRPGSSLYLVTTPTGEGLAGNVGSLEPGILEIPGLGRDCLPPPRRAGNGRAQCAGAGVAAARRHPAAGGARPRRARTHVPHRGVAGHGRSRSSSCSGCSAASIVSRRVLKRVEAMTGTAQTIMAGDLSGRLSVIGTRRRVRSPRAEPPRTINFCMPR